MAISGVWYMVKDSDHAGVHDMKVSVLFLITLIMMLLPAVGRCAYPSLAEAQPGDLAFFDHADRDPKATNISHVGLLLDNQTIIHCSGCVHIDSIDKQGIHLADGELTHHLVQIKRYL
jgi:cell wall-associated NlpC family hydrolase